MLSEDMSCREAGELWVLLAERLDAVVRTDSTLAAFLTPQPLLKQFVGIGNKTKEATRLFRSLESFWNIYNIRLLK